MLNKDKYEYVNKETINRDLLCTVCNNPFTDPRRLPCSHVCCFKCLTQCEEINSIICPTCQKTMSNTTLKQISRPLQNMLDRLQVKCSQCGVTDLMRGNFDEHINVACPKANVFCLCADVQCSWSGAREQLNEHLTTCPYQPVQTKLMELIAENRQLKEALSQEKARNDELEKKSQEDKNKISGMAKEIRQLKGGSRDRMQSSNSSTCDGGSCLMCKKDGCQNGRLPSYGYANLGYIAYKPTVCHCDCHK